MKYRKISVSLKVGNSDIQHFNWLIWRKQTTLKISVQTYVPVGGWHLKRF